MGLNLVSTLSMKGGDDQDVIKLRCNRQAEHKFKQSEWTPTFWSLI